MRHVQGSITDSTEKFIAHGCNARGKMGAGVALAIRQKWPHVFTEYAAWLKQHFRTDAAALGLIHIAGLDGDRWVFNCITQIQYGRVPGRKYAVPDAIERTLNVVAMAAKDMNCQIAIPKIGCSLGGLNWDNDVRPIIDKLEEIYGDRFVVYSTD